MPAETTAHADRRKRIIDATQAAVESYGIRRFTIEDVARDAGVSRQTVYEYFASKDVLVLAFVERAAAKLANEISGRFAIESDPVQGLRQGVLTALTFVRAQPPFDTEARRAEMVPFLTTKASTLITTARSLVCDFLDREFSILPDTALAVADIVVRMVISHTVSPDSEMDLEAAADAIASVAFAALSASAATALISRPGAADS